MTPAEHATFAQGRAARLLMRPAVEVLLIAAAALTGYVVARATPREPFVVTLSNETLEARIGRTPRGSILVTPQFGQTPASAEATTTQVSCTLPAPDPGATCVNGFWQTAAAASTTGAARFDRANGCVTVQPAGDMICRNGLWTLRGAETSAQQPSFQGSPGTASPDAINATSNTTADPARAPSSQSPSAGTPANAATCSSAPPAVLPSQVLTCVNGAWVVR